VLLRLLAREHFARLEQRQPDANLPWLLRQVARPDMLQVPGWRWCTSCAC
jgi:hypothetical protein